LALAPKGSPWEPSASSGRRDTLDGKVLGWHPAVRQN
jgi:hypothetical protein